MTSKEIATIKMLMNQAKHSFITVASLTDDTRITLILAKWPDVLLSVLDYFEGGGVLGFNRILIDFGPLVYQPIAYIAESYLDVLKSSGSEDPELRSEYNTIMNSHFTDPVDIKAKLINLVNRLVPILNKDEDKDKRRVEPIKELTYGSAIVR